MIYCPHCRKPSIGKKATCLHCGKRLPRPKPKPKPKPKLELKPMSLPEAEPKKDGPSSFEVEATVIAHETDEQAKETKEQAAQAKSKPRGETQAVKTRMRLGEILVGAGALLGGHLKAALNIQESRGLRLGTILVEENLVGESQLVQALAYQADLPWVDLENMELSKDLFDLIPPSVAKNYLFFPVDAKPARDGKKVLLLAMDNPLDKTAIHAAAARTGMRVKPVFAMPSVIETAIDSFFEDFQADSTASPQATPVKDNVGQEDVIIISPQPIATDVIEEDESSDNDDRSQ
ncbi:MAG: hypothetical protein GY854_29570 [Deltaproteobacteria bacterium]|nr:hypothetical protein [Deltaproteobacteria bacterium]